MLREGAGLTARETRILFFSKEAVWHGRSLLVCTNTSIPVLVGRYSRVRQNFSLGFLGLSTGFEMRVPACWE